MAERTPNEFGSERIAHLVKTDSGEPIGHLLIDHLLETARLAREFAAPFSAGNWAYLAGLWHDIGKYSEEFQAYIRQENGIEAHIENVPGRVDHSTAGAQYAVQHLDLLGHLLAYIIAGHHSGLLDGRSESSCQEDRLRKRISSYSAALPGILKTPILELPENLKKAFGQKDGFAVSFFVRMVFSS